MKRFSLVFVLSLAFLLGACTQTKAPDQTLESQAFLLSRTYVDKDAVGANDGTNWANAFTYLQDALDCVRSGICPAPIWVAAGVYFPDEGLTVSNNDATESFYLIEGVNMYGGFDGVGAGGVGGARELLLFARDTETYKTILSGDLEQNDVDPNSDGIIAHPADIVGTNSQHVVYVDAAGSATAFTDSTVLDGFRITAGKNGAPGGSGLYCNGSATFECSPRLANLVFRGNAAALGGAVYNLYSNSSYTHVAFIGNEAQSIPGWGGGIYNILSNLTMIDIQFTDNSADYGGGIYNNESDISITGGIFELNQADWHGGAIQNDDSNPSLTDLSFVANNAAVWGGAIFNLISGPTLLDVGFYGNSASGGGAIANEINGGLAAGTTLASSITNTVFSGNTALNDGGAIYNFPNFSGGTLDIDMVHISFSRNSAASKGGSIYTEPLNFAGVFDMSIVNSIMWNSTDTTGFNEICLGSGLVDISFSDVRNILGAGVVANCDGGISTFSNGGNNRNVAPQFVDFDGVDALLGTIDDDLDLQATSPVIDKGQNTASLEPFDFMGRTRIVDGDANGNARVDMGAYEKQ